MHQYLMLKDIKVLLFDMSKGYYEILNEKYLPFAIHGRIKDTSKLQNEKFTLEEAVKLFDSNGDVLKEFFGSRVLPLSRHNAKKVYNLFGLDQSDDIITKLNIAFMCRAISLQDNYWIKKEDEHDLTWDSVDLRKNSLNDIVAQVSLHGTRACLKIHSCNLHAPICGIFVSNSVDVAHYAALIWQKSPTNCDAHLAESNFQTRSSFTVQGSLNTPELTGQGMYAKAWRREEDGKLWLYKKGFKTDYESRVEVLISNLLDNCNVDHVHYEEGFDKEYVCKVLVLLRMSYL